MPCGVLIAPVLPGLSDRSEQLRAVTEACVAAGAVSVTPIALHLRPGVREHYLEWLGRARPDLTALYAERFRRGSYQPEAESRRIAEIVEAVGCSSGGAFGARRPAPSPTRRPPPQRAR